MARLVPHEQHGRILLVDDEVSIQRSIAPLLRSRGYEVDVVGTGNDALKAFAQSHPDLIVLDLGLPDIDGAEVCRRIRSQSQVPILVLSARGGETDKVGILDMGADDYVTKPFSPEELLARIRVAAGALVGADGPAAKEDRARPGPSAVPGQRTVGRLSTTD